MRTLTLFAQAQAFFPSWSPLWEQKDMCIQMKKSLLSYGHFLMSVFVLTRGGTAVLHFLDKSLLVYLLNSPVSSEESIGRI